MQKQSASGLSIIIAAGTAFLVLVILVVLYMLYQTPALWVVMLIPVLLFIIANYIIRIMINRFISSQVYPQYRSGHNIHMRNKDSVNKDINHDIISGTEQEVYDRAGEKQLELEKLKGLELYRKDFLGNVYHELKTPIFNMQGYILTLLEGGLEDKDINKLYLERTESNINRMISIVEDLESISGLESGILNLNMESFNIRKIVKEVFEANEIRARKLDIKLETGKSKESQELVKGDKKRIFQVLNNLVVNSISYGVKGGKTIINYTPTGNKLLIEVIDNGIGISKSDITRVFERFYRVDKSRSRESGGTGLGLAIVKHILEAHTQTVRVSSVPGKGTTFAFTLDKG